MRQATHNVEPIVFNEGGSPMGLSLGFDFCAEHEFGIESLSRALKLGHAGSNGLEQHLAVKIEADDPRLTLYERKKATKKFPAETRLVFNRTARTTQSLVERGAEKSRSCPTISNSVDDKLAASWNDAGFCIRATGDKYRQLLRDLHQAFLDGDMLVSLGGGGDNPFARAGLCLTRLSLVPQSVHEDVREAEAEAARLAAAVEATGIHKTLEDAGRRFYALSPQWLDGFGTCSRTMPDGTKDRDFVPKSAHPVIFFLNPQKQDLYDHGWFTVEELEAWAVNEGPIVKRSQAA